MLGTLNDFTIMRLRVKGSGLDPLALRPRLERLISEVHLPSFGPATAIVFIRKLEDPLPGLLQLETIDSRASHTWRGGLTSKFEHLVSSAARPARGPVSSSAEAVVFYDYSELLACLTKDWCNGFVAARWWWQTFLRSGDIARLIKQSWREQIEYAPAALEQLSRERVAVDFAGDLTDDEAYDLVEVLTRSFSLPLIARALNSMHRRRGAENWLTAQTNTGPPAKNHSRRHQSQEPAPWRHIAPESATNRLTPSQQLFLGLGLTIGRAPSEVRKENFAREVERWYDHSTSTPSERRAAESTELKTPRPQRSLSRSIPEETVDTAAADLKITTEVSVISPASGPKSDRAESDNAVFTETADLVVSRDELHASGPRTTLMESSAVNDGPTVYNEPPTDEGITPSKASDPTEAIEIETQLGGVFYLVNLAIYLGLYSDFTRPVESLTELSIWDFVALVAGELDHSRHREDPIWKVLAELAGRDPEVAPGHDFEPPLNWRASADWMGHADAFADASSEEPEALSEVPTWLARLLPHLCTQLRRALGIDAQSDVAEFVLQHRAKVVVTATHVDVFFALAELPIEIRLSGLDRNPGWVPSAGRFISFHYD